MTGEMSKYDLDEDGEWGLFVKAAKLLHGSELCPFDVYHGPYLRYHGLIFWFTCVNECEVEHAVWEASTETMHPLPCNPCGFQEMEPEDLAEFIAGVAWELENV